jgi:hypothetical protein
MQLPVVPESSSAAAALLAQRWQLSPAPRPGTMRAEAVAQLAAWPARMEHRSLVLLQSRTDVSAAQQTAPRWHQRGDFRAAADCAAVVCMDSIGAEHLCSIAQMQLQLVRLHAARAARTPPTCHSACMQRTCLGTRSARIGQLR